MSKKAIVVGGGIAGLTAAIYAQRSGFSVTLIERHTMPGGMCNSWMSKRPRTARKTTPSPPAVKLWM